MFEGLLGTIGSGLLWATGIALVVALVYSFFNKDKAPDGQSAQSPGGPSQQRVVAPQVPERVVNLSVGNPVAFVGKFKDGIDAPTGVAKNARGAQIDLIVKSLGDATIFSSSGDDKAKNDMADLVNTLNRIKAGTADRFEFAKHVTKGELVKIGQEGSLRTYVPDAKDDEITRFKKWADDVKSNNNYKEGEKLSIEGNNSAYAQLVAYVTEGKLLSSAPVAAVIAPAASAPAAAPAAPASAATPAAPASAAAAPAAAPASAPAAAAPASAPAAAANGITLTEREKELGAKLVPFADDCSGLGKEAGYAKAGNDTAQACTAHSDRSDKSVGQAVLIPRNTKIDPRALAAAKNIPVIMDSAYSDSSLPAYQVFTPPAPIENRTITGATVPAAQGRQ